MVERNVQFDGYICTNATAGEDIPKGAVLRQSLTVDREMVQTTGASDDLFVLGVAVEDAVSGGQVCMAVGGEFRVLVEGAVNRGDFLSTSSTTTGVAASTGTGGQDGDFAISLVTDSSTAVRLIPARFKKAEAF